MKLLIQEPEWKEGKDFLNTLPKRLAYWRKVHMRLFAKFVLDFIKSKIPKGKNKEWDHYLKSLVIREEVIEENKRQNVVVLESSEITTKLSGRDIEKTVVYVSIKSGSKVTAATKLLSQLPWTLDTIPALPGPDAHVEYKVVSEKETSFVREQAKLRLPGMSTMLTRLGIKKPSSLKLGSVNAIQDTALIALRLEYGLSGQPHISHLRLAIERLKKEWFKLARRDRKNFAIIIDTKNKIWTRVPDRIQTVARGRHLRYDKFKKKIKGS